MSLSNLLELGKLIIIEIHISGTQLSLHRQLKQTAKKIKCSQNIFIATVKVPLQINVGCDPCGRPNLRKQHDKPKRAFKHN